VSRLTLGPTQASYSMGIRAITLGIKQPGHETDSSPPSSAEVKTAWSYTTIPPKHLYGVVLN